MKNRVRFLSITLLGLMLFDGCQKNLRVEPYPRHYSNSIDRYIMDNKGFWNADLKRDINDYKAFVKNTFKEIDDYQYRMKLKYNKKAKKRSIIKQKDLHDEVLYEWYK